MKTIQPIKAWYNGQEVECGVLYATCFGDNLSNNAGFQYQIMKEEIMPDTGAAYLQPIVQGNLNMTGEAYDNWETNDYAYQWVANQLNLIITGPYVPPVGTTSTTTSQTTSTTTTVAPSTTSTTTTKKV